MSSSINLVEAHNSTNEEHTRLVRRFRVTGLGMLLIFALFSAVLFVIKQQTGLNVYKQEEVSSLRALNTLQGKQAKVLFLNGRLQLISTMIAKRPTLDKDFGRLSEIIPQNVTIETFQLEKKELHMSLSSPSLLALNTFLDTVANMVERNDFLKTFTINNLELQKGSGYSLTVVAHLL